MFVQLWVFRLFSNRRHIKSATWQDVALIATRPQSRHLTAYESTYQHLHSSLPSPQQIHQRADGSLPLRWKLWGETTSNGMKAAESVWESSRHYKALLLHHHSNGEECMCWSHSLKVTQYLHVLIIPPRYERNITSRVSMMKTHIRSAGQCVSPMNMENLPSRLRQGNELHISCFH